MNTKNYACCHCSPAICPDYFYCGAADSEFSTDTRREVLDLPILLQFMLFITLKAS